MTNLEIFGQKTMSSREIAELTNKEHRNVLRDCDVLNEHYAKMGLLKIEQGYFTTPNTGSQQYREYMLTKMQTMDLMTGYNIELRIKVNRRWEELETKPAIDFSNPDTVLMLAQNWKEEQQKRIEVEKRAAIMQPKADFVDRAVDMGHLTDIGQAAKILKLPFGRNTLFKKLQEKGVFFKGRNEPKQEYIQRGYFELREKEIPRDNHPAFMVTKVLVTQKGLFWLSKTFNSTPQTSVPTLSLQ